MAPGSTFEGQIPGYNEGDGTLVSLTTAMVTNKSEHTTTISESFYSYNITNHDYTLAADSIQDVTNLVHTNGTVTVSFPASDRAVEYIVYASYSVLTGERACVAGPNPQNFIQNGSFVVDHFSPVGAKVTTDFLEKYVFVNGVREILKEIGNYSTCFLLSNPSILGRLMKR